MTATHALYAARWEEDYWSIQLLRETCTQAEAMEGQAKRAMAAEGYKLAVQRYVESHYETLPTYPQQDVTRGVLWNLLTELYSMR